VEDGYGGLEHRASTALIAARRDLPRPGMDGIPDGYLTLLGLISHEYFHTWNVKRLKPAELAAIDWQRENHTELLWFFEGFTSYYDELLLQRCGLIDAARYLRLLAKTVNAVAATPGRQVQSVAEASFDAWVKYYRADENTPNATVSYYPKGALVALCLDLRCASAAAAWMR
jgi:predicted metalloprotease with PDZ domain